MSASRTLSESLRIMANSLRSAGHHSCRAAMLDAAAKIDALERENTDLKRQLNETSDALIDCGGGVL